MRMYENLNQVNKVVSYKHKVANILLVCKSVMIHLHN